MAEKSTFDSLWEGLKQLLPGGSFGGGISALFDSLISKFTGMFGGIFSFLAGPLGISDKIDEFKNKAAEFTENVIAKVDQDLVTARKGTATAIDSYFETNGSKLGLEGEILARITADTKATATEFYTVGIPALNEGRPVEAYSAALKYRKQLVDYLVGDGESTIGALAPETKNREQTAEQIATAITGIPAGATLATVAAAPPKAGLAATLAAVQTTVGTEGFVKDSLQATDITMAMDNTAKAQTAAKEAVANTPQVTGAATVAKASTPATTPKAPTTGIGMQF